MKPQFIMREVPLEGKTFRLQVFADAEGEFSRHFDEVATENAIVSEPPLYGCLWPSAEGLARYLWPQGETLRDQKVLEIGCGLALPSLVCAARGARVTAMDHHPQVLPLVALHTQLNGLPPLKVCVGSFTNPELDLGRFSLIIGSDILYEPDNYPALEAFILRHALPGARVICADPGRYAVEKFGMKLRSQGEYQLIPQLVPGHPHPIEIRSFQIAAEPKSQKRNSRG